MRGKHRKKRIAKAASYVLMSYNPEPVFVDEYIFEDGSNRYKRALSVPFLRDVANGRNITVEELKMKLSPMILADRLDRATETK